ncbi:signal recognition particle-docking protein FtsY [Enterococcus xiangfangensis]|uniref:signal recognition particle-docking protein FtsY n=1 Tax=Enterococcus xiangfangensis TaxID=1296537 RepID=UPI0010F9DFC1|nr:signal recognition particle-docking protein FtsY [Enterococcus xiangfangensis]MBM7711878.1 fused signal recognition particle receptor [Enterococcus xiangfangensis]NBK08155.1 signal recognition particle-docking protein FtsY [Enterococcus asini]
MGLFDRIKKAFTGEQKETEKPEEVIEDQETADVVDADADAEKSEPTELTKATDHEEPAELIEETAEITDAAKPAEQSPDLSSEVSVEPERFEATPDASAEQLEAENESEEALEETLEETQEKIQEETIPAEPQAVSVEQEDSAEVSVQEKYDKGLEKTRKSFGERMNELFARFRRVDEDFFEELEETLIGADVGFDTAIKLTDSLRQEVKLKNVKKPAQIQNVIIEKLVDIYEAEGINENNAINLQPGLSVILFVGVNGTGKTTSIGKLAKQYKAEGKKVLLAAADTFRAGAIDQLVVWGERSGVEVVRGNAGGDPAAVVFDAVDKAKNENYDILLIDTAGRLQNKVNLMNELEKIKRVIQREFPTAPHEVLLVVDATTGQNALVQARQFKETTDVTGLVLTKLDGTAKGGIVLAIRNELHLPVKLVGLGEGIDDLEVFDSNDFAIGLFKGLLKEE